MITVGDFIVNNISNVTLYFVKSQIVIQYNVFILTPVCSAIHVGFREEFLGCIRSLDRIATINDLMNMNYIHNHKLMNKAMEYLIERHRL